MVSRFRYSWLFRRRSECAELRKRASDYLGADIAEAERERIRRHLADCESCERFFKTLGVTITLLKQLPARAIPQALKARLSRIPEERKPPHR